MDKAVLGQNPFGARNRELNRDCSVLLLRHVLTKTQEQRPALQSVHGMPVGHRAVPRSRCWRCATQQRLGTGRECCLTVPIHLPLCFSSPTDVEEIMPRSLNKIRLCKQRKVNEVKLALIILDTFIISNGLPHQSLVHVVLSA